MDKIPAGEIKEKSPFLKWLDNFWYHNKIPTIIIFFILFVVIVCTLQMCTAEESADFTVMYSGPYMMTGGQREGVRSVLNAITPDDDTDRSTDIISYHVLSEEQIKKKAAETDVDGRPLYEVNRSYYTKEYESYNNMLMTGEISICMLDPWLYQSLEGAGRLKRLEDVLGEKPQGAIGACGVRLGDTELYKYYDALQVLPEDTVLCVLTPYVFGATSKQDFFEANVELFRAIVNFTPPQ